MSHENLALCAMGLSPRVRGNPAFFMLARYHSRSIPACAGEPSSVNNLAAETEVYPRVCGGTALCEPTAACRAGLSPRVRGNRELPPGDAVVARSIPACAGEPMGRVCQLRRLAVYPRVCGGTREVAYNNPALMGLSPRVRGNRLVDADGGALPGSIPACAGEPPSRIV